MSISYSAKSQGFYHSSLDYGDNLPDDLIAISDDYHAELLDQQSVGKIICSDKNGYPIVVDPPLETPEQAERRLQHSVQSHLDDTVKTRGYDGILSACTYATSSFEKFRLDGQAAVEWRDAVWSMCYQVLADVQAGIKPMPTEDDLIALLPMIDW